MLGNNLWLTTQMAISGSLLINRITKLQAIFNSLRAKIKKFIYLLRNLTIAHVYMAAAISIDIDIDGTSHTNSIRHLHQHFVSHTGCHQVLGNMTGCISGTTVYLTGVLTGESATTVSTFTTVGIYDNLASRQTGISVRSADNELSGRINVIGDVVIEQ